MILLEMVKRYSRKIKTYNQNKQFSVHFWYEEDSLKPKQIKDFISEYETELKFKTL